MVGSVRNEQRHVRVQVDVVVAVARRAAETDSRNNNTHSDQPANAIARDTYVWIERGSARLAVELINDTRCRGGEGEELIDWRLSEKKNYPMLFWCSRRIISEILSTRMHLDSDWAGDKETRTVLRCKLY